MERLDAQFMALQLMLKHGLVQNGWTFRIRKGGTHFCGTCNYRHQEITLGIEFVLRHDMAVVRDTVLHEIAHALLDPSHGHDQTWRNKCIEIGAEPTRLIDRSKITRLMSAARSEGNLDD